MKRKVVIIPDNVVLYIRVATEEQASNSDTLVLRKKEAIELYNTLQKMLFEVPYTSVIGDDV